MVAQGRRGVRAATSDDLPLYTMTRSRGDARASSRASTRRASARAICANACMLQLREAGLEQSVPFRLVRDCFDELINHRWSEISKRFGISPADVQKAADEIAKLDPEARARLQRRERQLHHSRSHRRQDRRPVSRLPQRRQPPAPQAEQAPTRRSRATRRSSTARTRSSSPTSSTPRTG